MATGRVIDIRGLPETKELLDSFSGNQLQNRVRVATRAGAKVMRTEVRKRAGESQYPRSFKKTATRGHRNPVGTSTGPTSPLLNIFEGGAGQHVIAPGSAGVLSNFNARRDQAGAYHGGLFFARGPVMHPGMAARPLIGPVFEATKDEATDAAMDALFTERPARGGIG